MSALTAAKPILHTPGVVGGSARIGNTRIAVWVIVHWFESGMAPSEIRRQYENSGITDADVESALDYAREHREEIERDLAEQDAEDDD